MMGCVHYTLPAAHGFLFLAFIIYSYGVRFIIAEQEHIRPLFYKRACLRLGLFPELQLPPIIRAHLVRLFKLS